MNEINCLGIISNRERLLVCLDLERTKENFYIFTDYLNGGDLEQFIEIRGGKLSEDEIKVIGKQIVEGMIDLHNHNIAH